MPIRRPKGHPLSNTPQKYLFWAVKQLYLTLIKKKVKLSSYIYKEIQNGAVAKSYMRKGFLIYDEMRKYLPKYEEAVSHYMTLQLLHSEFPYMYIRKIWFSFLSV